MKIKSIILLVLMAVSAMADHVHDKANLFGANAQALESKLASSHVYVATFTDNPQPDIEGYSKDALNKINGGNSFMVVVVKNSHQWRITMHPSGLVSPNLTKAIGDSMVAGFKRGDFYGPISDASDSLDKLAGNPPVVSKTVTTTTRATASRGGTAIAYRNPFAEFLIFVGIIIGVVLFIGFVCWLFDWITAPRMEAHNHYTTTPSGKDGRSMNAEQKEEARRVYAAYSPAQRQQMCMAHPQYAGYYNDPMQFWYMMTMMNMMGNHNSGYYHTQYADYATADPIQTTTTERTETSYQESTPSGSDNSGSGGSWSSPDPTPSYSSPSSSSDYSSSDSGSGSSWGSDSGSSSGGDCGGGSSDSSGGSW